MKMNNSFNRAYFEVRTYPSSIRGDFSKIQ